MSDAREWSDEERKLAAWIEANVGGTVARIDRLQRWRPGWDVDVALGDTILPLHARGEREANFAIPYRIADELPIHDLLEAHGLPVPHAFGLCDEPYALVMDRLPGLVDLSFAGGDDVMAQLIDEYLHMLPTIYGISTEELVRAGLSVPESAEDVALASFRRWEVVYDELITTPDPVAAFLRKWLHDNHPRDRAEAHFVTYDAFQFMFESGRITGLLDFELSCVGDPMMDLGALRVRDTIKNLGDLVELGRRFEKITGIAIDHDAVDYHCVMYNTLTVLSAGPPIAAPERTTDYVSHMAWYVNSARWAFEIIAEMRGFELQPVAVAPARPSRYAPAYAHLLDVTKGRAGEQRDDYELASLFRHARHLVRVDELGPAFAQADLAELSELLGRPVAAEEADAALIGYIAEAGPAEEPDLVRLLDRHVQREQLLLGPDRSLLLRHPPLRHLRPGVEDDLDEAQRWPAGVIPGT